MIRIGIETATSFGTVAVAREDRVLAEIELGAQRRHAEMALPGLARALEDAGLRREEIGEVVVGGGPGSFTGVRVAAATAKGLVAALGVPLRAFSSLLALAAAAAEDDAADRSPGPPVCALFDARRGEVYAGCWRFDGDRVEALLEPMVGTVEEVMAAVSPHGPVFAGDGARAYAESLASAGAATRAGAQPRAGVLLRLAARHPAVGRVTDVAAWEPAYVRASSAERGVAG